MLNIRRGLDGSFWIPRSDKETEDYLDGLYVRVKGQLKWVNKIPNILNVFAGTHQGTIACIIGKGVSLDFIKARFFSDPSSPIICINESIHQIEKLGLPNELYVTQLDSTLLETCRPTKPDTKMFVGPQCANLYLQGVIKYVVDPASFGLNEGCISAQYAVMLARHMGCLSIEMYCFDGCVENSFNYANCIGYDSGKGGPKIRFASHRSLIKETAKNVPLTWITPRATGNLSVSEGL